MATVKSMLNKNNRYFYLIKALGVYSCHNVENRLCSGVVFGYHTIALIGVENLIWNVCFS